MSIAIFSSVFFTVFATVVMSYISMATPIGPWAELSVVLLASLIFRLICCRDCSVQRYNRLTGLTTAAAGVGGIIATVCGFAFPTLYFLDRELFLNWMQSPLYFAGIMGGLVLCAGSMSFILTRWWGVSFLEDDRMPFPIGSMVAKVINAQNQLTKSIQLLVGGGLTFVFEAIQKFTVWLPGVVSVFGGASMGYFQLPAVVIPLDLAPLFIAIGCVAGAVLTLPLFVGVLSQVFVVNPTHMYFFAHLSKSEFILAFGCGMVLQGAALGIMKLPGVLVMGVRRLQKFVISSSATSSRKNEVFQDKLFTGGAIAALFGVVVFFWLLHFSLLSILYLAVFATLFSYQLLIIGGKTGLAPFGRFATLALLPGLLLFRYTSVEVTLVSVFIGLVGALSVDLMFGRKMAQQIGISQREVELYQLLGLVVSACVVGCTFWLLISHFGLGSQELLAQRAQARALLVQAADFDYLVLALGFVFSFLLKFFRVNPTLVFTGLLFNVSFSLLLILGGIIKVVSGGTDDMDAFWSGIFAAGSIWMIVQAFA